MREENGLSDSLQKGVICEKQSAKYCFLALLESKFLPQN